MPRSGSRYGGEHQRRRALLLRRFRPGDLCSRCGGPMLDARSVQLGHPDAGNGGAYALEHQSCNQSAGGKIGGATPRKPDRNRVCPICHSPFHAEREEQLACCRAHTYALKRGDDPWPVAGRAWLDRVAARI